MTPLEPAMPAFSGQTPTAELCLVPKDMYLNPVPRFMLRQLNTDEIVWIGNPVPRFMVQQLMRLFGNRWMVWKFQRQAFCFNFTQAGLVHDIALISLIVRSAIVAEFD
ncbi:hypothetical protein ACLOJK_021826 [Asimina triloba]